MLSRLATTRTALQLPRCTCTPSLLPYTRLYSAAAPPDKLILAATKLLAKATQDNDGNSIEAAKRERELQGLRRALEDVQQGEEVSTPLLPPPPLLAPRARSLTYPSQLVETLHSLASEEADPDLRELAEADLPQATETLTSLRSTLFSTLLPPSPTSTLSALLEIKSGVGGSESSLFAAELVRMYSKLAARKGWKASLVETVGLGGVGMGTGDAYREAILEVSGEGAFGVLRREAGVHRVQRVPATESQGRVHTSTVGIIVGLSRTAFSFLFDFAVLY